MGVGEHTGKQLTAAQEAHVAALDPRYLETEVAINGHTALSEACSRAFQEIILKTHGQFGHDSDTFDPVDVRFTRTVDALTEKLPEAGLTEADWQDLFEVYEIAKANAARLRHIYDWLVAHPEILVLASEAGLFVGDAPMRESDRIEAEITGLVRRFWRRCSEAVKRRGYLHFQTLGMVGAGVGLYIEDGAAGVPEVHSYRPLDARRSA